MTVQSKYFYKIFLLLGIITLLIPAYFTLTVKTTSAAELFYDDFSSGNSNNWTVIGVDNWQVVDGEYGILLNPGLSDTLPKDDVWNYSWKNISFSVDLRGVSGTDKNILIKYVDLNNRVELHHSDGILYLERVSSSQGYRDLGESAYTLENGIIYHLKFEIIGEQIKVYINNNIIFDVTDPGSMFPQWKIGLRVGTGATSPTEVWFDNVKVEELDGPTSIPTSSPTPTPTYTPTPEPTNSPIPTAIPTFTPSPLPTDTPTPTPSPSPTPDLISLNVPDIKQYSPPWGGLIYDSARKWSSNPYIKNWGCALTSASMILKYYGHQNTNPDVLNNWLISQPDGYLDDGLVNWIAVTRYAKLHASDSSSALEYARFGSYNQTLVDELKSGRPVILREPGHFVVAKSITPNSFGINDPGYSSRTSLLSYNNTFSSIYSFYPSHTDLSYILVTVNANFDLKVINPSGSELSGFIRSEEPLVDDVGGIKKSGTALKIFEFQKPENGDYTVEISGIGAYDLKTYHYDVNGNVSPLEKTGNLRKNQKETVVVSVPKKDTNSLVKILLGDLDRFWNQRKIKSGITYGLLKSQLTITERLITSNNGNLAVSFLRSLRAQILYYTPRYIEKTASNTLLEEIDQLLKALK